MHEKTIAFLSELSNFKPEKTEIKKLETKILKVYIPRLKFSSLEDFPDAEPEH